MTSSKRFTVVNFFAAIALSTLCNSVFSIIVSIIDSSSDDPSRRLDFIALFYSASLAMFMIKYFVDDVIDDRHDNTKWATRSSLAPMVTAWTWFILAALLVKNIRFSAFLWALGLVFITDFLCKNRRCVGHYASIYICQNTCLFFVLIILVASEYIRIVLPSFGLWPTIAITGILTLLNRRYFSGLFQDDTEPQKRARCQITVCWGRRCRIRRR